MRVADHHHGATVVRLAEHGVLDVPTDLVRERGVEDLVVERDAGATRQRRHLDPRRSLVLDTLRGVDAEVQPRMSEQVVDDPHPPNATRL